MSLFVLDTAGNQDLLEVNEAQKGKRNFTFRGKGPLAPPPEIDAEADSCSEEEKTDPGSEEEDDGDYGGLPPPSQDISELLNQFIIREKPKTKVEEEMECALRMVKKAEESRTKTRKNKQKLRKRPNTDLVFPDFDPSTGKFGDTFAETNVTKEMEQAHVEGFEQKKGLPKLSEKKLKDLRRIERGKNKGEGWFNMPATEVTEEVENDLKILQMRSVLNPKHFYKKNDLKVLPKFFQIGTVQSSPLDYYKERDTRKSKKRTLVDELLADAEFQKYTKRKYKEVSERNDRYAHKKAMNKMKKLKKNK